jgi:hypothetical protein
MCLKIISTLKNHTIVVGKVTTLDHKVLDNTVEGRALVPEALLASSKSTKSILSGDIVSSP